MLGVDLLYPLRIACLPGLERLLNGRLRLICLVLNLPLLEILVVSGLPIVSARSLGIDKRATLIRLRASGYDNYGEPGSQAAYVEHNTFHPILLNHDDAEVESYVKRLSDFLPLRAKQGIPFFRNQSFSASRRMVRPVRSSCAA